MSTQLPIKVLGLPQTFCFTGTTANIIQQIADALVAEAGDGDFSNVVVGNSEPTNPQTTALWIRQDNSGTFVGLYVYSGGTWLAIYPIAGQLTRVYGSSTNPPAGYQSAEDDPLIPAPVLAFLQTQWLTDGAGGWLVYDVTPAF